MDYKQNWKQKHYYSPIGEYVLLKKILIWDINVRKLIFFKVQSLKFGEYTVIMLNKWLLKFYL